MLKEDKLATEVKEQYQKWLDSRKDWDTQAREDIDFYLGNHFNQEEMDMLAERNQASMPMDRLYGAIEQFKAIITSKPPKFSSVPREDSDTKMSKVWNSILEYIWDISDGNETFKQVIHDYAVTGLGYFYAFLEPEADFGRGEIKFTHLDPFRVVVDPNSRNRWFDDASQIIVSTILTESQLLDTYPKLEPMIKDIESMMYSDSDYPSGQNLSQGKAFTPDIVNNNEHDSTNRYRVLECFRKVKVAYYRFLDKTTGEEKILDTESLNQIMEDERVKLAVEQNMVDVVEVMQPRIKQVCTVGQIVLFERVLNTDIFPVVPVPNIWTNTPYPMSDVRKNKDFQRFLNKLTSLITTHAQASAGLKLLIPQGSVQDVEELERDWANPNATIEYDASFGEPHFPAPQPLANSIMDLPKFVEHYIDLNMGIFEMQQGNTEAAPRTSSGTMMMEDFGQRRSKSKLRDVEGSLRRLGKVCYNLAKYHYDYPKTFRIVQPNNDLTEYMVNKRMYNDATNELMSIHNDLTIGQFDVRIIGNSTMPSNKWGEWNVYMEAYQAGLIDRNEALKKTEIFDKEGVLSRMDMVAQLQQQLQGATEQIKKLEGDLQTAHREAISSRKRTEVEKFKADLKKIETDSKAKSEVSINKLNNAVRLEAEKLRANNLANIRSDAQKAKEK